MRVKLLNQITPSKLEKAQTQVPITNYLTLKYFSDSALEQFWEGILYGYVVDSEAADYLSVGDVIFKVPKNLIAISSDNQILKKYDYFDNENTAAKMHAISAKVGEQYGAFSAAASMQVTKNSDSDYKTARLDATFRASNHSVRSKEDFRTNPENYLTTNFKRAVMKYSCKEIEQYIGSFYAKEFKLGAKFKKTYTMHAKSTDTESSVTAELKQKYGKNLFEVSDDAEYGTTLRDSKDDLKMHIDWQAYGGDTKMWLGTEGSMENWANTITDKNLDAFDFELGLIWDLVKKVNKEKGDKFQEYLEKKWDAQAKSFNPSKFYGK